MVQNFDKVFLTWEDIEEMVEDLAGQIIKSGLLPKYIHGLQRGGLIPAVMLSHILDVPMGDKIMNSNVTLIVDDISDSGKTFINALKPYGTHTTIRTASLHHKLTSRFEPTYYSKIIENTDWIVYPWEAENSKTIQDYKL